MVITGLKPLYSKAAFLLFARMYAIRQQDFLITSFSAASATTSGLQFHLEVSENRRGQDWGVRFDGGDSGDNEKPIIITTTRYKMRIG